MKPLIFCLIISIGGITTARAGSVSRPTAGPVFSANVLIDRNLLPFYKKVQPAATVLPSFNFSDPRFGSEGTVEVGAVVQPDGSVSGTFLKAGNASDGMKRSALSAVKQWKFPVIIAEGKPIKYSTSTTIKFLTGIRISTADRGDMSHQVNAWSEIE